MWRGRKQRLSVGWGNGSGGDCAAGGDWGPKELQGLGLGTEELGAWRALGCWEQDHMRPSPVPWTLPEWGRGHGSGLRPCSPQTLSGAGLGLLIGSQGLGWGPQSWGRATACKGPVFLGVGRVWGAALLQASGTRGGVLW